MGMETEASEIRKDGRHDGARPWVKNEMGGSDREQETVEKRMLC